LKVLLPHQGQERSRSRRSANEPRGTAAADGAHAPLISSAFLDPLDGLTAVASKMLPVTVALCQFRRLAS